MADIFGDRELFLEFEKDRPASDEILMQKLDGDSLARGFYKNSDTSRIGEVSNGGQRSVSGNGGLLSPELKKGTASGASQSLEHSIVNPNIDYIKKLERDNCRLVEQNSWLQNQNRLINVSRFSKCGSGPLLQVLFMNSSLARHYRTEIERFVTSLIQRDSKASTTPVGQLPALSRRPNYVHVGSSESEPLNGALCDSATVIGACQYYGLFIVDTVGWPLIEYNPSMSEGWQIPKYEQVFMEPLPVEGDEEDDELSMIIKVEKRPKRSCFNCGGEHNLADCKTALDHKRIGENRRQFKQKCSPAMTSQQKQTRYHADEDPRFAGLKAGIISDGLRSALGLTQKQLPPYIYQMRRLGYPPGHLENARQQTSGLSMFGKYGLEVDGNGELMEDGEVKDDSSPKVTFDVNKIIDYPGFNVALDPGVIDEWERLQMLPMQMYHAKDVMQRQLSVTKSPVVSGAKRQSSGSADDSGVRMKVAKFGQMSSAVVVDDMDLDESVSQTEGESDAVILTFDTPTEGAPSAGGTMPNRALEEDDDESYYVHIDTPPRDVSECSSTPAAIVMTPVSYGGTSISFTLGTPIDAASVDDDPTAPAIPKSLPDRSRFSVGVSDHILYENLPNATGTYRRLREVMRSISRRGATPVASTPPPQQQPSSSTMH
jgi:hypothetical protein